MLAFQHWRIIYCVHSIEGAIRNLESHCQYSLCYVSRGHCQLWRVIEFDSQVRFIRSLGPWVRALRRFPTIHGTSQFQPHTKHFHVLFGYNTFWFLNLVGVYHLQGPWHHPPSPHCTTMIFECSLRRTRHSILVPKNHYWHFGTSLVPIVT